MFGFAVGSIVLGRFSDRSGIVWPLTVSAAALFAGYIGASIATSIWFFALMYGVIGFGASAVFGPLVADVSHWFVRHRGFAVAAVASGNYFAGAIWPLAMQVTLRTEGWRFTHAIIGF